MKKLLVTFFILLTFVLPPTVSAVVGSAVAFPSSLATTSHATDDYSLKDATIDIRSMLYVLQSDMPNAQAEALAYFTRVASGLSKYDELDSSILEVMDLMKEYNITNDKELLPELEKSTTNLLSLAQENTVSKAYKTTMIYLVTLVVVSAIFIGVIVLFDY